MGFVGDGGVHIRQKSERFSQMDVVQDDSVRFCQIRQFSLARINLFRSLAHPWSVFCDVLIESDQRPADAVTEKEDGIHSRYAAGIFNSLGNRRRYRFVSDFRTPCGM